MPALPDWKNFITEADPATPVDATSPYSAPLSSFQIGHNIEWDFRVPFEDALLGAVIGMGISFGTATGSFEYKLMEGGQVSFWQKVSLKFQWTALLFGGFLGGGLDFFVWQFVSEQIDTYVIDGAPTDKHPETPDPNNPAWRYTIGGTEFSEFGIAIPGGGPTNGNGVGINGGHISSFWQGPLYQNARVGPSAGLDIINDYARGSFVGTLPLWHIRALTGADEIDAYFQAFNPLHKSYARNGQLYFSLAALPGIYEGDRERGLVGPGGEPSINEDLRGLTYASYLAPDGKVYESVSDDTGETWKRRRIRVNETTTELKDLEVWGTGYNMPRSVTLEDGHRGTITYKNGSLWFKSSRDDYRAASLVAEGIDQEAYELSVNAAGIYYVSSPGRQEYYSDTSGDTWKPVKKPEGA